MGRLHMPLRIGAAEVSGRPSGEGLGKAGLEVRWGISKRLRRVLDVLLRMGYDRASTLLLHECLRTAGLRKAGWLVTREGVQGETDTQV